MDVIAVAGNLSDSEPNQLNLNADSPQLRKLPSGDHTLDLGLVPEIVRLDPEDAGSLKIHRELPTPFI